MNGGEGAQGAEPPSPGRRGKPEAKPFSGFILGSQSLAQHPAFHRLFRVRGGWLARMVVASLFAALVAHGADGTQAALTLAAFEGLGLAMILIVAPWTRTALQPSDKMLAIYVTFAGVLVWACFTFLPFPVGMAKLAWAEVGSNGAITIDRSATYFEILKLVGLASIFLMGVAIGNDDDRAHSAFNMFGFLALTYTVWSIVAFYRFGDGPAAMPLAAGSPRLMGTLMSPNITATVLAIFATMSWTALLRKLQSESAAAATGIRWFVTYVLSSTSWVILLGLSFWALALTGSRGGAIATCVGLMTATAIMGLGNLGRSNARRLKVAAVGALVLAVAFLVILQTTGEVAGRFATVGDGVANRSTIISIYASHLKDIPWTGYGLGTFKAYNALLIGPSANWVLWDLGALHNVYLQWIYEAGYPGAFLMFLCIGQILLLIFGGLKRRRLGRTWMAAALAVSAVVLTHGMVDYALQLPAIASLWAFALGCGVGVSRP